MRTMLTALQRYYAEIDYKVGASSKEFQEGYAVNGNLIPGRTWKYGVPCVGSTKYNSNKNRLVFLINIMLWSLGNA